MITVLTDSIPQLLQSRLDELAESLFVAHLLE